MVISSRACVWANRSRCLCYLYSESDARAGDRVHSNQETALACCEHRSAASALPGAESVAGTLSGLPLAVAVASRSLQRFEGIQDHCWKQETPPDGLLGGYAQFVYSTVKNKDTWHWNGFQIRTSLTCSPGVLGAVMLRCCLFKVLSRFLNRLQSLLCALLYCLKHLLIGGERSAKHTHNGLHPRYQVLQSCLLLLQFLHQGTSRLDMALGKLHGVRKRDLDKLQVAVLGSHDSLRHELGGLTNGISYCFR
jgi:hypothetical protein